MTVAAHPTSDVASFLTSLYGAGVTAVSPLEAGAWSTPFGFKEAERDLVIRFSATEEDFRKDERAARFRSPALPIPRVIEIGEAFGGFFAVSDRASGTYLERADAASLRALLPRLFAMLDAIRDADIADTTGYGSWGASGQGHAASWSDALLGVAVDRPTLRIYGWSERLRTSRPALAAFREGLRLLEGLAGRATGRRHLIHSDLLNRNVLVNGGAISAVLDWGSALYGDFLFDLAWLWFWSPWSEGWQTIDFRNEAALHYEAGGMDVPAFEERLRACALYIGLDGMTYQAWKGGWADLEATAERLLEVSRG